MKTTNPVTVGIDTRKAMHVAVSIDTQGTRLATYPFGDAVHSNQSEGVLGVGTLVTISRASLIAWMQRVLHDLFSLGKQQRDPRHKEGHQK